ncbi:hypothetical protein AMJ57_03900 [Parcubacteria bacterium SG8_24]|nr:MAG: hypothetical protein AMJ57_03900 [Parcubacteria bacterium SG8_24]
MEKYPDLKTWYFTTRETFPGELSFSELSRAFFGSGNPVERARFIVRGWKEGGLLVHMANPEQLDDLFSHIDRERQVRFLSTSYVHVDIRPTVYAIGRGTGLILDSRLVRVDHVSVTDSATVTAPDDRLVASDERRVSGLKELHETLCCRPQDEWNEVNVSFEGPAPIIGLFSLDGVMSKIYATVLYLKAERLLPVFAYNRERNELFEFRPDAESVAHLISQVPVPELRERYSLLLDNLSSA